MRRRATFVNKKSTGVDTSLVGYWAMEEGSGSTLLDSSVNGNNATLQNSDVAWVTGQVGLALSLPGTTNRYAIAPHSTSLNITEGITISAYIKRSTLLNNVIMTKGGSVFDFSVLSTGKLEFVLNRDTNGTTYSLLSLTSYPTDGTTWMHVAATFDGTTSKIYIDKVEDSSATYTPFSINTNTLDLYIGAWNNGNNRWNGQIDELRLYNRALSSTEISNL